MKKYLIVLSAVLMSMNLFAETTNVAFEANGRTKVMTVDLPHTFSCDYSNENGELDVIIQELYELSLKGYCASDATPVRTGNTMVSAGKNGSNQYITVEDVFDGKAVVKGKYYKHTTGEVGSESINYSITISIWEGKAVGFNVYSSWANDNTTLSTSDFPNFLVIPEVKAQTMKITDSGTIYVIYDITGNGDVKCAVYNDRACVGLETLTNNTRKSFYGLTSLRTFYYSYALTPVTPATPVISGDKYFVESNTVTITCASKGAVIYYTLNGISPAHNPYCPVYEDPFEITENTTVMAASYNGDRWSDVAMMEFKHGERVVFVAKGNRKEVVAPLPHTFSCGLGGYAELDSIIQELYKIDHGGCDDATPVASGNAAVTAGKNGNYQYITVSEVFYGLAKVNGVYRKNTSELSSEPFNYSLTVYINDEISLEDNANNSGVLSTSDSKHVNGATLQGRTLYKDGGWNTLCLPFDVDDFSGTPLEGAIVKTLVSSYFESSTNTLTLNFTEDANNLTSIEAGKPYIIKWASGSHISNPVFTDVTIRNTAKYVDAGDVIFTGCFSRVHIDQADQSKLYVGNDNRLYYPSGAMTIKACRAYFQLSGGLAQSAPPRIVMNLDGEETATDLEDVRGQMAECPPDGTGGTASAEGGTKVLIDGSIYILRDGITYDALGRKVSNPGHGSADRLEQSERKNH